MDQDIKNLLEENFKLTKDNHEMLLKLKKIQQWTLISRIIYWFIIIGIAIGAFYFIKPFLSNLASVYGIDSDSIMNILK